MSDAEEVMVQLNASLSEEEWRSIREFKRRALELAENSLIEGGVLCQSQPIVDPTKRVHVCRGISASGRAVPCSAPYF